MTDPIPQSQIDRWKKKAAQSDYGSSFFKPPVVAQLIKGYEQMKAERDALIDEQRSMFGYDLAQIWAEYSRIKARLEAIQKQFPAGQMEMFE